MFRKAICLRSGRIDVSQGEIFGPSSGITDAASADLA